MRITNQNLKNQRVFFFGAGSAGIGIANIIASAMQLEGLSPEQARSRIWLFNSKGLIENTRQDLSDQLYSLLAKSRSQLPI